MPKIQRRRTVQKSVKDPKRDDMIPNECLELKVVSRVSRQNVSIDFTAIRNSDKDLIQIPIPRLGKCKRMHRSERINGGASAFAGSKRVHRTKQSFLID